MSSDDGSNGDNTEEIVKLENDSNVRESHAPEVPRKQKFANIDEITVLDNFDSLPSQEHNASHYLIQKTLFLWAGTLIKFRRKSPCLNVTTVWPGSRSDAKNVSNPLESFLLFISDDMINEIVTNTNNSIWDFRDCFRYILAGNFLNIVIVQLQVRSK